VSLVIDYVSFMLATLLPAYIDFVLRRRFADVPTSRLMMKEAMLLEAQAHTVKSEKVSRWR